MSERVRYAETLLALIERTNWPECAPLCDRFERVLASFQRPACVAVVRLVDTPRHTLLAQLLNGPLTLTDAPFPC